VVGGTVTLTGATVSSNSAFGGTGGLGGVGDNTPSGHNGNPGLGQGGGLYIAPSGAVGLDPFTLQHVVNNTAFTSYHDLFGSYTLGPLGAGVAVTGFPSTVTAGAAGAFIVTANNATGPRTRTTPARSTSPAATPLAALPADYTFTAADAGVHTFSATLKTAGTQSLTVTDTTSGRLTTETGIIVNPASASTFSVTGVPVVHHRWWCCATYHHSL